MKLQPLAEASRRISEKTPIGSRLRTAEWARVPLALRERAMFSAGIESVRFLSDARRGIEDVLTFARETTRGGDALIDRSSLIAKLREVAKREGIPVDPKKAGGLQDITSRARLALIIETQLAQAREFARWKAEQDPDILAAFPAQELVRIEDRAVPRKWRDRWVQAGGRLYAGRMVAAKNDPVWSRINRFGTPWPPFDFNSGMGVEDIGRDEAEALGVIAPGQAIAPAEADFNQGLSASVANIGPAELALLRSAFGDQLRVTGGTAHWRGQAPTPPPAPRPVVPPAAVPVAPAAPARPSTLAEVEAALKPLVSELAALKARMADSSLSVAQRTAAANELAALNERARVLVEVPEAERKAVTFATLGRNSAAVARAGAEIVSRFVHADLIPTGLNVKPLRGNRAYYTSGDRALHINSRTSVSTAAHEITHDIEFRHPAVIAATKAFLVSRSGGRAAEPLRKLTGNRGYKPDEIAYEDEWQARGGHVYAGKVYPWSATELLTMGIERLNKAPVEFLRDDPEYFKFLVKTLRKW